MALGVLRGMARNVNGDNEYHHLGYKAFVKFYSRVWNGDIYGSKSLIVWVRVILKRTVVDGRLNYPN